MEVTWTRTRDLDITKWTQRSGKRSVGCVYSAETWLASGAVRLAVARRPVALTSSLIYKVLLAFVDRALTVCAAVFTGFNTSVVENFFTYICQFPFYYCEYFFKHIQ